MDYTKEELLHPRSCKCEDGHHFRASHPDVIDFYRDFETYPGEAAEVMAKIDAAMLAEFEPANIEPGRPLKYTTPADLRRANREYQRRWREKNKEEKRKSKELTDAQELLRLKEKYGVPPPK